MKATTLAEAMNLFDARLPLEGEGLKLYYAKRYDSPLKDMIVLLRGGHDVVKLLVTGQRGSGKSTELNRLAEQLGNQFFIVRVSVAPAVNPSELTFVDLLLSISNRLFQRATDEAAIRTLGLSTAAEGIFEGIYRWWTEYLLGKEAVLRPLLPDLSLVSKVNVLALQLEAKLNVENPERQAIRERAKEKFSELVEHSNRLIEAIRNQSKKEMLIIVEDVDKTGVDQTREIFIDHAYALTALNAKMVCTFPAAFRHANDFPILERNFNVAVLPCIKIADRAGTPDLEGQAALREIVLNRLDSKLITSQALEALIQNSGGLVGTLIKLLQSAAICGISKQRTQIDLAEIEQAIVDERTKYQSVLKPRQYDALLEILTDKMWVNDNLTSELLDNQSVLEYNTNGNWWCDVNPIVRPMLGVWQETYDRLRELRNDRKIYLERSGKLQEACRVQSEILRLTVEITGRPTWISAVQQLLDTRRPFVQESQQSETQDAETQSFLAIVNHIENTRSALDHLSKLIELDGNSGRQVLEEAKLWCNFSERLAMYRDATSAAHVGRLVDSYKLLKLLHDKSSLDRSYYDYSDELHDARRALLDQIFRSASKRLSEGEFLFERGQYAQAANVLEEIESVFYQPFESDRDLRYRLNERGSPLGRLRTESQEKLKEAKRLAQIAAVLEQGIQQIQLNWRRTPTAAQDQILSLELDDPEHECKHLWKQIDRLAEHIREFQESNRQ